MPSRVIRRSRRQGRMMNHQKAIGSPATMTAVQVNRIAFMNVGGSLGPGGTRSKWGPAIQRIHTYSWKARMAPPAMAQVRTGLALGGAVVPSEPTSPIASVTDGALLLLDSSVMTLPSWIVVIQLRNPTS